MAAGISVTTPPATAGREIFTPRFRGLEVPTQVAIVQAAVACASTTPGETAIDSHVREQANKFLAELFKHTP